MKKGTQVLGKIGVIFIIIVDEIFRNKFLK